jgi:hypothetical protein
MPDFQQHMCCVSVSNQLTAAAEQLRHNSYQKTKLDRDLIRCVVVVKKKEERSSSLHCEWGLGAITDQIRHTKLRTTTTFVI